MRPRLHPALRRVYRDERTLQLGAHPRRAVILTGLSPAARRWLDCLDGGRDLAGALREARSAGLPESSARALLDRLARSGVLDDAGGPAPALPLPVLDRMRPDLDAMDLAASTPGGGRETLRRRARSRVRVYGAGRVGAQVVALLAAAGVGGIRVFDPEPARPCDLTPGGLTWAEVGMTREEGAVAVASRLAPPRGGSDRAATRGGNGVAARDTGGAAARGGDRAAAREMRGATVRGGDRAAARATRGATVPDDDRAAARATRGAAVPDGDRAAARGTRGAVVRGGDRAAGRDTDGAAVRGGAEGGRRGGVGRERVEGRAQAGGLVRGRAVVEGWEAERDEGAVRAGGPYLGDRTERPDLVVVTPVRPLDLVLVNELSELGIPHLLGSGFEGHGIAGPLVIPGQTACLHCLDLTRRDHDPAWPVVTARLGGYPPGEIACDASLAASVAAAVAGHALGYLDGHASVVMNGTTELSPDQHWEHRTWAIHPDCRCIRNSTYPLTMVMSATCE